MKFKGDTLEIGNILLLDVVKAILIYLGTSQ